MLECRSVSVRYGRLEAIGGVSLTVGEGQIVSIIGANGAGKTTMLRAISGLERVAAGEILLRGSRISDVGAPGIARRGIAHVPAGRAIFPNLTVVGQLRLGAYALGARHARGSAVEADLARVLELLPVLGERAEQEGRMLSGGEQQMLAIARALMARPALLMLDEPSLGLAPVVVDDVLEALQRMNRDHGLTVLLVEQNAHLALDFASHAYVLERGAVARHGPTEELRRSGEIAEIYLGVGGDAARPCAPSPGSAADGATPAHER